MAGKNSVNQIISNYARRALSEANNVKQSIAEGYK